MVTVANSSARAENPKRNSSGIPRVEIDERRNKLGVPERWCNGRNSSGCPRPTVAALVCNLEDTARRGRDYLSSSAEPRDRNGGQMAWDDDATKAEIDAYKAAIVEFERALRAKLPGDVADRLCGYKMQHRTLWFTETGKAVSVCITIDFVAASDALAEM